MQIFWLSAPLKMSLHLDKQVLRTSLRAANSQHMAHMLVRPYRHKLEKLRPLCTVSDWSVEQHTGQEIHQ